MPIKRMTLEKNQAGFAAIVIALVIILVLSLITVGFGQLMQHELRAAADRQLSSQAYYAAETGINDATAAINSGYSAAKTTCGIDAGSPGGVDLTQSGYKYLMDNTVGNSTNASYPCLLINPTPPTLQYGNISTVNPEVFEFEAVDSSGNPQVVQSITISWQDAGSNPSTQFTNDCSDFYPASGSPQWNSAGILRTELIPIKQLDRQHLITNAYTGFLCPSAAGSGPSNVSDYALTSGPSNSGVITGGNCAVSGHAYDYYCSMTINDLGSLAEAAFFMALRSIYHDTTVSIAAYSSNTPTSATQLNLADAQILIDSTGKAQDVLRRIQVRLPVHNLYPTPPGTQGMSEICKQLQLVPAAAGNSSIWCN